MSSERVQIEGPIRGAGLLTVRAELEPDALPFDNARYDVVTVPPTRRIGLFVQDPASMSFVKLALEQSLAAYKRGAELLKFCQAQLADAQQQVKVLEAGVLKNFAGDDDDQDA